MIDLRYTRNIPSISEPEQQRLQKSRVLIVGCGGLGGNILSQFLRIGIGAITVIDGDCFEPTNLNRQLLCTQNTIGLPKVQAAKNYARQINPDISVTGLYTKLNDENCDELVTGYDLALDALDNIDSRRILARACEKASLPLVYGAICGWTAQVCVLMPDTAVNAIQRLYPAGSVLNDQSCLSFTPAVCASIQAAEAVKLLLGKPSELIGQLFTIDLLYGDQALVPICPVLHRSAQ